MIFGGDRKKGEIPPFSGKRSCLFSSGHVILAHKRQSCHHVEASQLTCSENRLTGFYMIATLTFNELR